MLLLTVTVPFGLGYFASYLFRTVNAIISPQLTKEIGLTAAELGFLTSVYFIMFAAFQLPLGVLLDRYGPRRVQTALLVVAALGGALFAVGRDMTVLTVARGLIGLGVSGCLMAALKANVMWWPRARLPLINGITASFGSLGALVSTVPVELILGIVGWRGVFAAIAAFTALAALLVWFGVPRRREESEPPPRGGGFRGQLRDFGAIYGNAFFWRISVMALIHNAVFMSYQSLWTGSWLRDVAGLDRIGVANALLLFNLGMFVGVLLIGLIADRLQGFGVKPIVSVALGVALSITTQFLFALGMTSAPMMLCFAFGFFGSSTLVVYAVFGQHFPPHLIARVNTAQNMLIFASAFAVQWGVGEIIDLWPAIGEGRYHPQAQQTAMFVVVGLQVAAFAWFLWPRRQG